MTLQDFLVQHSNDLCQILSPLLVMVDLGRLTKVCHAFRNWAVWQQRTVRIEFTDAKFGHGRRQRKLAMQRNLLIRLTPRFYSQFVTSDGATISETVPMGTGVDLERSYWLIELVGEGGIVLELLLSRHGFEEVVHKFMIKDVLSSHYTALKEFVIHYTAVVFLHGSDLEKRYVKQTSPFIVVHKLHKVDERGPP